TETPETPEEETPTDREKSFTRSEERRVGTEGAGRELTYTITDTITGDVDYDGIVITDAIPDWTTYVDGSATAGATLANGALSWTVDVPFGETRSVSFTVVLDGDLTEAASIISVATVTGDNPDTPETPEEETPTDREKSFT